MKYILKGENDYLHPIQTVLKNRNIDENLFILDNSAIEDYNNYDNMQEGIDLLLKHINNNDRIELIQDPDTDGLSSFAMLYRYIKGVFNYKNLTYQIHTGKKHGLSKEIIIDNDVKLIILPDSSSNDYEQHKYYKDRGIDILVLDHHEAKKYSENAIVINNQLSQNVKNKNFSGAGVTYKFLKALDNYLFEDKADYFIDLLMLGNTADVMNLKENETRYYVYRGLREINNPFLKALIEISSFQLDNKLNINSIGWVIAPKLNGMVRSGTNEEKLKMAQAFISDDYEFCLEIANLCKNVKSRQDNAVKSSMKNIEKKIKLTKKDNDKVLIIEVSKTLNPNHTGLVAGKLSEEYGIPCLLSREVEDNKEFVGGSGRTNDNITNDFKQDLINSKLFKFCEGHPGAFGFQINKENIPKLKQYLNELYKGKEIINGKTYEVDFILNEETLDYSIIEELARYEDEWGNGIPEPLILFQDIHINITDENIKGKKAKNLIFEFNNIKFIKKFLSNDLKNKVLNQGELLVDIIGKCTNNIYNNDIYPQVEVVEIQIN